jgi:hypothetical protein
MASVKQMNDNNLFVENKTEANEGNICTDRALMSPDALKIIGWQEKEIVSCKEEEGFSIFGCMLRLLSIVIYINIFSEEKVAYERQKAEQCYIKVDGKPYMNVDRLYQDVYLMKTSDMTSEAQDIIKKITSKSSYYNFIRKIIFQCEMVNPHNKDRSVLYLFVKINGEGPMIIYKYSRYLTGAYVEAEVGAEDREFLTIPLYIHHQ